eukprot:SAG31_NODE_30819_length_375_cov_1.579710_1_plen_40_part_10
MPPPPHTTGNCAVTIAGPNTVAAEASAWLCAAEQLGKVPS